VVGGVALREREDAFFVDVRVVLGGVVRVVLGGVVRVVLGGVVEGILFLFCFKISMRNLVGAFQFLFGMRMPKG
tara:strand:+ start:2068 stop:2289 length:222 start_codon:yes stop_codon:yes gene_type:complete